MLSTIFQFERKDRGRHYIAEKCKTTIVPSDCSNCTQTSFKKSINVKYKHFTEIIQIRSNKSITKLFLTILRLCNEMTGIYFTDWDA